MHNGTVCGACTVQTLLTLKVHNWPNLLNKKENPKNSLFLIRTRTRSGYISQLRINITVVSRHRWRRRQQQQLSQCMYTVNESASVLR